MMERPCAACAPITEVMAPMISWPTTSSSCWRTYPTLIDLTLLPTSLR